MQMSFSQWLLLLILSMLWACSFFFVSIALRELPPTTVVLVRVALAAAALAPIVRLLGHTLPSTWAAWQPFVVMSLLNNVIPFTLMATGQREITSALTSVLNATTPVWTLIIAHLFTADEKLAANKLAGVLLGIAGVAVLVAPALLTGERAGLLGMALVLGGTISYGFSGLWARRFKTTPPLVTACCQLTCSSLVLLPIATAVDQPWLLGAPGRDTLFALAGLALPSTALAYIVFFRIMAVSGPSNAMLVTLLIPPGAIALGVAVLGERLEAHHILGALVIASALIVIDGRLLSGSKTAKAP